MKLSNLLKYKQYINSASVRPAADYTFNHLGDIVNSIQINQLQFGEHSQKLQDKFNEIDLKFQEFQGELDRLNSEIDDIVASQQPAYFSKSYQIYEEMITCETTEYILDRGLKDVTDDIYNFISSRIELYDEWRYPAAIIRPGRESFVEKLVGCDPLYLLDQSHDLLSPSLERFGEKYQTRLRPYVFKETREEKILKDLPDDQFGFFLAYNFFNFRPLELIEQYFSEIYQKLKPGGVLALTYNNCDLPEGTGLTEVHFMCYTPGKMLEQLAKTIGFEIHFRYDTHVPNTWLELKKPGELTSLRGGQSLATIKNKT